MYPKLKFLLLFMLSPVIVYGQAWSGIINSTRAIDWSAGGIPAIPTRTTICTTLNPGASSSTINAALAACPANQVVFLNAGTYTLSSGINYGAHNNVTLRGAGPDTTTINFNGGDGCFGLGGDVCMVNSTGYWEGSPNTQPGGGNAANWTAGYAQGATTITLSSTAGLSVGGVLILDQANDAADTHSTFVNDDLTFSQQGGAPGRTISGVDYDQQQFVSVTSIAGAIVGISPGLYMNNWRNSQNPKAWWTGAQLVGVGIENLTLNHNGSGSSVKSGIYMYNCYQCYVKNVRSLNANRNHVWVYLSSQSTIRDSYFNGTQHAASQSYGVEFFEASNNLVENNIFDNVVTSIMPGNSQGNIVAYNYGVHDSYNNPTDWLETAYVSHDAGTGMNLFEGNQFNGLFCDDIHGTSNVGTIFRDRLTGFQTGKDKQTNPILFYSYCRSNNVVGNVLGTPSYHTSYETSSNLGNTTDCNIGIYNLGRGNGDASCVPFGTPADDNLVRTTLLRWGNYDTVTGTVRWDSSEVPTLGTTYIGNNPVPATHTLPASFYLASRPGFFVTPYGTPPYPPIGPDVTGGSGPGGFSYDIPAKKCYDNSAADSSLGGTIIHFDAAVCYGAASTSPVISTSSLPNAMQFAAYSTTLVASGGTLPYTWAVTVGSLPTGLSLNTGTGVISGTPTATATSSFTVRVTDAGALTNSKALSITVAAATGPAITTSSLSAAAQNVSYSTTVAATAGTAPAPFTWTVSAGSLPTGLSINSSTGAISGTPTVAGAFGFTIKCADANSLFDTKVLSINVVAAVSPTITTNSLPSGTQNVLYSGTVVGSSGTPPYSWSVSAGGLPTGLSIDSSTGIISGTPIVSGTISFTAKVTDANALFATKPLSISVTAATPAAAGTSVEIGRLP